MNKVIKHGLQIAASLDPASKKELQSALRSVFTEESHIDFNTPENIKGLQAFANLFKDVFQQAGKSFNFADIIKMPGKEMFDELKAAANDFEDAWSSIVSRLGDNGLKNIFMKDQNDISMALERLTNKSGQIVKSRISNIVKAFDEVKSKDVNQLLNTALGTKNTFINSESWEEQTAAALRYMNVYEKIMQLTKGGFEIDGIEQHLLPVLNDIKNLGSYAVKDLQAAIPQMRASLQNIFNFANNKPLIGLTDGGTINVEVVPVIVKTLDVGDLLGGKKSIEVPIDPVFKLNVDKLRELYNSNSDEAFEEFERLQEEMVKGLPSDVQDKAMDRLLKFAELSNVTEKSYGAVWKDFIGYGLPIGMGSGGVGATPEEVENVRKIAELEEKARIEAEAKAKAEMEAAEAAQQASNVITQDNDDYETIQKENGALEDKLELLRDIAEQYGINITQKNRDRHEELNQKDMDTGLTPKEDERYWELSEQIEEADTALEEFGETYDKIILKLANGKKVEILPDDKGLRSLYKFSDEYGETYGGVDIEDVEFVRKNIQIHQENSDAINAEVQAQEHLNTIEAQNPSVQSDVDIHNANADAIEKEAQAAKRLKEIKNDLSLARLYATGYDENIDADSGFLQEMANKDKAKLLSYLGDSPSQTEETLRTWSQQLQSRITPINDAVGRISKMAAIPKELKTTEQLYQEAAKVGQQISTMYDDGITDTEEYIALQHKLLKIFDTIAGHYGGVKGSGAKDRNELNQWMYRSLKEDTGFDFYDGSLVDALYEGPNSIYNNGKKQSMRDMAANLLGYKGDSFDGVFGLDEDLKDLQDINELLGIIEKRRAQLFSTKIQNVTNNDADITEENAKTEAIKQQNEALKENINLKTQADGQDITGAVGTVTSESASLDATTNPEVTELEAIKAKVKEVTDAVNTKTQAFLAEQKAVKKVSQSEVDSLGQVFKKVTAIKTALQGIKSGKMAGVNLGDVAFNVSQTINTSNIESHLTSIKGVLDVINGKLKSGVRYRTKSNSTPEEDTSMVTYDESTTNDTSSESVTNKLAADIKVQEAKLEKFRIGLEKAGKLTDEYKVWISNLSTFLSNIKSTDDMGLWKKAFDLTKTSVGIDDIINKSDAKSQQETFNTVLDFQKKRNALELEYEKAQDGSELKNVLGELLDSYNSILPAQEKVILNDEQMAQLAMLRVEHEEKLVKIRAGKVDNQTSKRASELKKLESSYAELGKLQAQADASGTEKTKEKVSQLQAEIYAKEQSLKLTQVELDELQKITEEAKKKESALLGAGATDKSFKDQIKEAQKEAGLSKSKSTQSKALEIWTSATQIEGLSQEQVNNLDIYRSKIENLKSVISSFPKDGVASEKQKNNLIEARTEVDKYTKEIQELIANYERLSGENANVIGTNTLGLGASAEDYQKELTSAVQTQEQGRAYIKAYDAETKTLTYTLKTGKGEFTTFTASIREADNALVSVRGTTTKAMGVFETIGKKVKEFSYYFTGSTMIYKALNELKKGITIIKDIDSALTELKKVTNETEETYDKFLNTAAKTGQKIGATVADMTRATATFAKLGYNIDQSAEMAKAATVYQNVGDGIESADAAAESIISTMKGFGIEASESMRIVDSFNEVGNRFAITSKGIGDALQRSASALSAGGNTLDESIGLITAANEVVQDPESVGTALKTKFVCMYRNVHKITYLKPVKPKALSLQCG